MSGGKPVISAARMYAVIVALDGGANVFDLSSGADQQAALRKALRCGYLRPSRFAATRSVRPAIVAYAVTTEGRDFLQRVEAAQYSSVSSSIGS
jgi:hypothetical protein